MIFDFYRLLTKISPVFILLLILSFQSPIFAQSGSIKGIIYDREGKSPLVGANIIIRGSSLGAASDLNGNYLIRNVPAGRQTFIISYIGYNADSVVVNIPADKTLDKDFYLSANSIQGKTVVITAQAQGQVSAIQQQLSSNKIENVVSEARIQELPDFNAAAAIGRLPGVSTLQSSGEANKVVIRGLAPQYNQVTIGGINLASTGSSQIGITSQGGTAGNINNDRSVDISSISSYMLKNITVYKELTPDLNANAIGGVVNMELREAPSELHSDLLWQSGYTQKSNTYGNYKAVASVSDRFFDNLLGVYAQGNIESYDRNADNLNVGYFTTNDAVNYDPTLPAFGYRPVRVSTVQLNHHIETRKRYGANVVMDFNLPNGSIKLTNIASRLSSDYQDYNTTFNYQTNDLQFSYGGGKNNTDLALNSLDVTNDFGFMQFDFTAANSYSRNNLPASPRFQFTETRGVGTSTVNTLPENLTNLIAYGANGATNTYLDYLGLYNSDYKENDQSYKTFFKFPFNIVQKVAGYFKVGGEYAYRQHNNSQNTPYANIGNTDSIQQRMTKAINAHWPGIVSSFDAGKNRYNSSGFGSPFNDSFLGNKFGSVIWQTNSGFLNDITNFLADDPQFSGSANATAANPGGWFDGIFQHMANTYKYIERYYAGYAMSELNYADLMLVGGVRYEKESGLYEAFNLVDGRNPATDQAFLVNAYPKDEFWLPMVQGRYNVTDWFDVRASYTQTLARPDFHQLSPHYTISYGGGGVTSGNPNLVPAQAYNSGVSLSFHSNEIGLISINGFYKSIKNFTYAASYNLYKVAPAGFDTLGKYNIGGHTPISGATLSTYLNSPFIAHIYGVEFDLQTRFWYLPVPFNGILLGLNYTHIKSEATYPFLFSRTTFPPRPLPSVTEVVDSSRAGRLINQPNDIVNAWIGYDLNDFSARVSFIFLGNAVSGIGRYPEQDGFTRDYFRIDATVKQVLPWYGIEVYLDLNNLNSEDNTSAQQSIGGFTNEQNYGLTANLGVRYRL
jgi:TonB-dependent receptor